MDLRRDARVYVTWPVSGIPDAKELEVTFNDGIDWHPLTRGVGTAKALVAGPDPQDNPQETIVLQLGEHIATIRDTDTPEIVPRFAGSINVV